MDGGAETRQAEAGGALPPRTPGAAPRPLPRSTAPSPGRPAPRRRTHSQVAQAVGCGQHEARVDQGPPAEVVAGEQLQRRHVGARVGLGFPPAHYLRGPGCTWGRRGSAAVALPNALRGSLDGGSTPPHRPIPRPGSPDGGRGTRAEPLCGLHQAWDPSEPPFPHVQIGGPIAAQGGWGLWREEAWARDS